MMTPSFETMPPSATRPTPSSARADTPPVDLSRAAFVATAPGSDAARALKGALELRVHARVMAAVERAIADEIAALNAEGHTFARDERGGLPVWRAAMEGGAELVVDVQAMVSTSVKYEVPEPESADDEDAGEAWFYDMLDIARDKEAAHGRKALLPDERMVLDLGEFEMEVQNGGFSQYFLNSPGDCAREALAALERIGAREAARLLHEAMALFGEQGPPRERDARGEALVRLPAKATKKLETLTSRYYTRAEPIASLAATKLRPRTA